MIFIDLNVDASNIHEVEENRDTNCNKHGIDIDLNSLPCEAGNIVERCIDIDLNSLPYEEEDEDEMEVVDGNHVTGSTSNGNDENELQLFEPHINNKRKKELSNDDRLLALHMLLAESINLKLKKMCYKKVASHFAVSMKTIQRLWKRYKMDETVSKCKVGNSGRKRICINLEEIRQIPLRQRTTIRSLSFALNVSKSTVFRFFKEGKLRRHSNSLKPLLSDDNKKARLKFCVSILEEDSIPTDPAFKEMYNVIHIDEKWFYMTKKNMTFYLLVDEKDPLRTCKNKNYIQRVMFLAVIARPRFDENGVETFSGKIGIFPFVEQVPAKRRSVNRPAGTLETKPISSVNREVMRSYFIEKLLPAIKEKWPVGDQRFPIIIQQDNAKPHLDQSDELFNQAARSLGLDIRVLHQPPNSPDLNVLDLGFFNAIQSLQYKQTPSSVDELVYAVECAFTRYPSYMANRIFMSLHLSMIEIMKAKGCNKCRIPHMNKERLECEGNLPTQLKCDPALVREVLHYLGV